MQRCSRRGLCCAGSAVLARSERGQGPIIEALLEGFFERKKVNPSHPYHLGFPPVHVLPRTLPLAHFVALLFLILFVISLAAILQPLGTLLVVSALLGRPQMPLAVFD